MTREEAIRLLDLNREYLRNTNNIGLKDDIEALNMAIKALSQEPCRVVKNELKVELNELKPCTDAVSREAVLNIVSLHTLTVNESVEAIKKLPPVQPTADLSEYSDKLWKNAYERGKAEARQTGKWDRLYNWLNDMRLGIAPDETVYDDTERVVRESQVDILDEIMEWMEKAESEDI